MKLGERDGWPAWIGGQAERIGTRGRGDTEDASQVKQAKGSQYRTIEARRKRCAASKGITMAMIQRRHSPGLASCGTKREALAVAEGVLVRSRERSGLQATVCRTRVIDELAMLRGSKE